MKHGKRPTKAQKIRMTEYGLDCNSHLTVKDTPDFLEVVSKETSKITRIDK